jgi:type I restriction enzyme M protein
MDDEAVNLVSRAEIARLAGVRRPAVSNWERRHETFPEPATVDASGAELFDATAVATWLDDRMVPSNARRVGEGSAASYGQRFREALAPNDDAKPSRKPRGPALGATVERLAGPDAVRLRGSLHPADYLRALLDLIHLKACSGAAWQKLAALAREASYSVVRERIASVVPDSLRSEPLSHWRGHDEGLTALILALDDAPSAARQEYSSAFDHVVEERLADAAPRFAASDLFTPPTIARTAASVLAPLATDVRIHDPFCRSGELLVAMVDARRSRGLTVRQVTGATANAEARRMARMRLRLRGHEECVIRDGVAVPSLGPPPLSADLVVANPPFNLRGTRTKGHPSYWRYGTPPPHNTNFDWLQYMAASVSQAGRAGVVMTLNAAFTQRGGEQAIRAAMVEDGVVECVIQFPTALFSGTAVAVTLWVLKAPTGRCEEVLFVNAERLGTQATRTRRELTSQDITDIADAYHSWRVARQNRSPHTGVPGLSRAVPAEEIRERDHALTPSLFVSTDITSVGAVDHMGRLRELSASLAKLHEDTMTVDDRVRRILGRYAR